MQVRVQNNNTTTHSRVAECIEVELVWGNEKFSAFPTFHWHYPLILTETHGQSLLVLLPIDYRFPNYETTHTFNNAIWDS